MKWIFLSVGLIATLPLSAWLRANPTRLPLVALLVGFLVVQHGPLKLYVAPISWAQWPGYVKGAEVSILDFFCLAAYFALPSAREAFPFKYATGAFIACILLSAMVAQVAEPALFFAWQCSRVALLSAVIYRLTLADERVASALLKGMGLGLLVALASAAWARIVGGVLQTGGSLGHQNTLGLMSHLITLPFFAMLLAGERGWLIKIMSVMGAVVAVLTVSRATLALVAFGYLFVLLCSVARGWSRRKVAVIGIGIVVVLAFVPVAISSFNQRLGGQSFFEPDEERLAFESAASSMLADNPIFGVGSNNWVVVANTGGYSDRAGVAPSFGNRAAIVHSVYWLVASEMGYVGLLSFIVFLAHPLAAGLRNAWRHRAIRGDILVGLSAGLLVASLHSTYEWVLVSFQAQYLLGASMGLIAGLSRQTKTRAVPARGEDPQQPKLFRTV